MRRMAENRWGGWRNQLLWRTCSVALLRFQTRVGGNEGTKGGKGEELASQVCVAGSIRYKCLLRSPPSPHFTKCEVRALQAWSLPLERVCCSVRIRSSRLHKQWIEGARLWRISAYSTRFVASYPHPSTSYKTMHIACQSPEIAPNSNNPRHQLPLQARERVRQILWPGGGEYPIGG